MVKTEAKLREGQRLDMLRAREERKRAERRRTITLLVPRSRRRREVATIGHIAALELTRGELLHRVRASYPWALWGQCKMPGGSVGRMLSAWLAATHPSVA